MAQEPLPWMVSVKRVTDLEVEVETTEPLHCDPPHEEQLMRSFRAERWMESWRPLYSRSPTWWVVNGMRSTAEQKQEILDTMAQMPTHSLAYRAYCLYHRYGVMVS